MSLRIVGLMAAATGLTFVAAIRQSGDSGEFTGGRVVLGGLVATVGLLAFSEVSEEIALGLAVVIAITSSLTAGPEVIALLDPTK